MRTPNGEFRHRVTSSGQWAIAGFKTATEVSLVYEPPFVACVTEAEASDLANRGYLRVDGSGTSVLDFRRDGSSLRFLGKVRLSRGASVAATRTVSLHRPAAGRLPALNSSRDILAEVVNPFLILNETYSGAACLNCHDGKDPDALVAVHQRVGGNVPRIVATNDPPSCTSTTSPATDGRSHPRVARSEVAPSLSRPRSICRPS